MKLLLIISICITASLAHWNHGWTPRHNDVGPLKIGHWYGKKGTKSHFSGFNGMKPEETTSYVVAQLGPGLVTDMTIFATCGGEPIRFTEDEILSGFHCKNEDSYACYKVCQSKELGFVTTDGGSMNVDKLKEHIRKMMSKGSEKGMDKLDECFEGKAMKQDGKCIGMKMAMQCAWEHHYRHCEPGSEFNKNKRLVGDSFWSEDD